MNQSILSSFDLSNMHELLTRFNRLPTLSKFFSLFLTELSEPCFGTEVGSLFLIDSWLNSGRGRCPTSTPVYHLSSLALVALLFGSKERERRGRS